MEESSRDSYQKLGDPGDEENNNTEKKCNKKLTIIIAVVLGLVVAGVVVAIVLLMNKSSEKTCPDGQYLPSDDDSQCYKCSPNCKQCKGSKSQSSCTACNDDFLLDDDICVKPYSIKGEYTTYNEGDTIELINEVVLPYLETVNIDGNQLNGQDNYYQFNTTGKHKVYFSLLSNVTDLSCLFKEINELNSVVFDKDFDTSNVTDMDSMFYSCKNLTSVNLANVVTTSVKTMDEMFYYCEQLDSVDISLFSSDKEHEILFDEYLPLNGSITLTKEFHEKIKDEIPKDWKINYKGLDIYDLFEN